MGNILLQLGPPRQVLYVVFISLVETKILLMPAFWDDFLVTAAVLERSTSASRLFVMIPENASFSRVAP